MERRKLWIIHLEGGAKGEDDSVGSSSAIGDLCWLYSIHSTMSAILYGGNKLIGSFCEERKRTFILL